MLAHNPIEFVCAIPRVWRLKVTANGGEVMRGKEEG